MTLLLAALSGSACSTQTNPTAVCKTSNDCGGEQVCADSVCATPCNTQAECPIAEDICIDGVCKASGFVDEIGFVARITASPGELVLGRSAVGLSILVVPVRSDPDPERVFQLSASGGALVVGDDPASSSVDLRWRSDGALGIVQLVENQELQDGETVVLRVTTAEENTRTTGDVEIPVRSGAITGTTVMLGSETIVTKEGWSVSVHRDFSSEFSYVEEDFIEGNGTVESNNVSTLAVLDTPFPVGFAVGAGRQLLVLPEAGGYEEHNYTPSEADSEGPDEIGRMLFVDSWPLTGTAVLFLGSGSTNSGDGLYRVGPDWSITRTLTANNTSPAFLDELGTFDARGQQTLYRASGGSVRTYPDDNLIRNGHDGCILSPVVNELVCITPAVWNPTAISIIESESHNTRVIPIAAATRWMPVAPGIGVGAVVLGLVDRTELTDVWADSTSEIYAQTQGADWSWHFAVVPPSGHLLAAAGPVVYILESNTVTDEQRILAVRPPPG